MLPKGRTLAVVQIFRFQSVVLDREMLVQLSPAILSICFSARVSKSLLFWLLILSNVFTNMPIRGFFIKKSRCTCINLQKSASHISVQSSSFEIDVDGVLKSLIFRI